MAGVHSTSLNTKIIFAHFDISGDANAHSIGRSVDLKEDHRYGDSWKRRLISHQDMSFSIAGNVDLSGTTDSDTVINARMGVNNVPLIIVPSNAAVGDPCEFGLIVNGQYKPEARNGDIYKYSLTGNIASRKWVRGKVLWSPSTSITGTANGSEVELGAVSSTQKLYVALAVLVDDFSNLIFKVQSDTTGFGSSTDQKTFTAASGITSEMPTPVDGPITDDFFRAAVTTFSGTSANAIVVAGIA